LPPWRPKHCPKNKSAEDAITLG